MARHRHRALSFSCAHPEHGARLMARCLTWKSSCLGSLSFCTTHEAPRTRLVPRDLFDICWIGVLRQAWFVDAVPDVAHLSMAAVSGPRSSGTCPKPAPCIKAIAIATLLRSGPPWPPAAHACPGGTDCGGRESDGHLHRAVISATAGRRILAFCLTMVPPAAAPTIWVPPHGGIFSRRNSNPRRFGTGGVPPTRSMPLPPARLPSTWRGRFARMGPALNACAYERSSVVIDARVELCWTAFFYIIPAPRHISLL